MSDSDILMVIPVTVVPVGLCMVILLNDILSDGAGESSVHGAW